MEYLLDTMKLKNLIMLNGILFYTLNLSCQTRKENCKNCIRKKINPKFNKTEPGQLLLFGLFTLTTKRKGVTSV